jgi:hypothetical protein
MLVLVLYLAGLILLFLGVYIVLASRRPYREAKLRQKKIDWALSQLERALEQTESDDDKEVLAGLQTLSVMNIPEVRPKVFQRLNELTKSKNTIVAMCAEAAIMNLSNPTKT